MALAFCPNHLLQIWKGLIQNLPIQEDERIERLVLSRCRDPPPRCKVRKELLDLFSSHPVRMAKIMKPDKSDDPGDVRLFGAATVVAEPDRFSNAVEEFRSGHASAEVAVVKSG
jgi:hypothetical protein